MTGEVTSRSTCAGSSVGGISGIGIIIEPKQSHAAQMSKTDEIEIQVLDQSNEQPAEVKRTSLGWLCCAPCIWIRTSTTVHKIAISAATLLVTSLLVASPILFLISTAPSRLPSDCFGQDDDDCLPTPPPILECTEPECRVVASSIQARMNWKLEPCKDFKDFSCSSVLSNLRAVKSSQEIAYMQMQHLLTHNTTTGPFRKLGRLYGSCLKQQINSSTIHLILDELGGYLPIGSVGPSSIKNLVSKIHKIGPVPIVDIYYDLSYGRKPQILLMLDGPSTSPHVLENQLRWLGPKAPIYNIKEGVPDMLDDMLEQFLPAGLSSEQKISERELIVNFIVKLNYVRKSFIYKDYSNIYVVYNSSELMSSYPYLNWTDLISPSWTGPIVIRNTEYFKQLRNVLDSYTKRVIHNSLLLLFALHTLPPGPPSPEVCTKATVWAMPHVASALFIAQFPPNLINDSIQRAESVFETLKAHLKRAPSLKGKALVKLSSLQIQAQPWPFLLNQTQVTQMLDTYEISSDNWFENIIKIYKNQKIIPNENMSTEVLAYGYPPIAKSFYDSLSHSIIVPLSVILIPYFNEKAPEYLHYATIGVTLAKEILRSITKNFEEKALKCVPSSVEILSNSSRMEILIYSGGMQIAYHSLLSLNGPIKGMERLPGLNLTPTQIFFLVTAQEFCTDLSYDGIDITSDDFGDILTWLISQGGSASEVFHCASGTNVKLQKMCSVL